MTDHYHLAKLLRALGHPSRIKIVRLLAGGPVSSGDIFQQIGGTQSAASQHLAVLREGWRGDKQTTRNLAHLRTAPTVDHRRAGCAGGAFQPSGDAMSNQGKIDRLAAANEVVARISDFGRRFFYNKKHRWQARFELALNGKLWFRDDYSWELVYVAYRGHWRKFSHGGTMRSLIEDLADYIRTGQTINPAHFGPWADWYCCGDLWGYGKEQMDALRTALANSPYIASRHKLTRVAA